MKSFDDGCGVIGGAVFAGLREGRPDVRDDDGAGLANISRSLKALRRQDAAASGPPSPPPPCEAPAGRVFAFAPLFETVPEESAPAALEEIRRLTDLVEALEDRVARLEGARPSRAEPAAAPPRDCGALATPPPRRLRRV